MGEAVSTLVGHTQCISSVVWPQHDTIYLASWDHSVKKWDVETGKDLSDIALNCIDIGGEGLALIAAGGSDPVLRIWDPRKLALLCFDWWQMEQEKPTTLDCGPRTICRRHTMTGSYLYECLWEVLQQQIRMVLINVKLTPYVLWIRIQV
ncbi:ribosome biogenesis protein WDR12 homolog isoform X2 [Gossypium hirsutum]|uniref:Ribosome biogenesis protein WDR12 homolog isoform X2 n=1 Tax=Gossypium hirsutum TaxID=3635 RepID=A0ABM3C2S3_GOSHI|nr:ribosome biogenesis protein WDR12 homolog isoform X2 [Gossypium hirsutum]